jgi:DNA-binding NtrC family response regulator
MSHGRILLVDDDRAFRVSTAALLRQDGHEVALAADGREAVEMLRDARFDLLLLDLRMPGTDGLGIIEALRAWGDGTPVMMLSGYGTVDAAVQSLHMGADDFLTKPVEPDVLSTRVASLLERRPVAGDDGTDRLQGLLGRTPIMQELFAAIRRVAPAQTTVLLCGETGTGKELAARAIHRLSPRRNGPCLAVNCASLAEGVLESELFGHQRGAFTGAIRDHPGLFQAAHGGTLFLDEIGEVPPAFQAKLLRVLQEQEVTPVGSARAVRVDVRVIAATHRELRAEIAAGRFREDLFYRLNVFRIDLPPLRRRREDVPLLVESTLARLREGPSVSAGCSPLAMRMLQAYAWPGNVRELNAVLERAFLLAEGGRIEAQHLPEEVRGALRHRSDEAGSRYRAEQQAAGERDAIVTALATASGVRARAAELLGMGRTTLWRKMKLYGLTEGASPVAGEADEPL